MRNAAAADGARVPATGIGRVLVTGATGFLGAHLVVELVSAGATDVACLVRATSELEAQTRLDDVFSVYGVEVPPSVHAVRGDVTEDLTKMADRLGFRDAVFHCAAITEHVGRRFDYERVNVQGTRRVLDLANMLGAQFMQISTMSVAGRGGLRFDEHVYDSGQDVNFNEYVRSKYRAEGIVLDAFASGLKGRILRIGNLTGRAADGVFQRDVHRNAFAMRLAAFARLGCYSDEYVGRFEMTPVDACAHAIVLLSTHESGRICHVCNDQRLSVDDLADLLRLCGRELEPVAVDQFSQRALARLGSDFAGLFGIVRDIVEEPVAAETQTTSQMTSSLLRSFGFSWPAIGGDYFVRYFSQIEAAVDALASAR